MKLLLIIICFLIGTLPALAEEGKVLDTEFVTVSSYLVLMTVFDIETTFSAIRGGAHEANPVMKPFVKNRAYMYGVQFGIDAAVIWLSYEMKGSKHKEFNKTWWIIPSAMGTGTGSRLRAT